MKKDFRKYIAEALGTFGLVFCGTGSIVINTHTSGVIGHAGVAITWGLIVTAMIYCFGNISGAHLNPAVTLSLWISKNFPAREILPYILSQALGAFGASYTLSKLFPSDEFLGSTLPSGSPMQSLVLEFILTFILVFAIFKVAVEDNASKPMAGLIIGLVVLLEAMFAGPVCGASMNPIRSLAPALVSGHTEHLWVYMAAPLSGGISAAGLYMFFSKSKQY
ncbi:MAG: MIP family channel protein [Bacteroidia bacterium]|nr:MIP family channel protein [Bacteroidia bacterium]